jgi:hypothetical protein
LRDYSALNGAGYDGYAGAGLLAESYLQISSCVFGCAGVSERYLDGSGCCSVSVGIQLRSLIACDAQIASLVFAGTVHVVGDHYYLRCVMTGKENFSWNGGEESIL